MISMKHIQTERLLLRDFEEHDWQAVHNYAVDPEVVRYMEWGPNTEEETRNFIMRKIANQKEKPRSSYSLAIILRDKDTLIGGCKVHTSNIRNREGEIGYCLNRFYWNQGYATETSQALLGFGFKELNLHRIWATCDTENPSSERVLEKIDMKREGLLRKHKFVKGIWRDSYLYAILEQEWKH